MPSPENQSSESADDEHPDELWTYAGLRLVRNRFQHAWLPDGNKFHDLVLTRHRRGIYTVGATYRMRFRLREGQSVRIGNPEFEDSGSIAAELLASWQGAHHAARVRYAYLGRESAARPRDELGALIAPLRRINDSLPTRADKAALVAWVISELSRP